jgi:hypothetical protein
MRDTHRSGCPVSMPLEVFGDKWSLRILHNMVLPSLAAAIRAAIVGSGCPLQARSIDTSPWCEWPSFLPDRSEYS